MLEYMIELQQVLQLLLRSYYHLGILLIENLKHNYPNFHIAKPEYKNYKSALN